MFVCVAVCAAHEYFSLLWFGTDTGHHLHKLLELFLIR